MAFWSVVKYTPKNGCLERFLTEAKRLERDIWGDKQQRLSFWLKTTTDEIVQLRASPDMETLIASQDKGLDWLDSVDHLLKKDGDGSRTKAYSGFEIEELRNLGCGQFDFS